MSRMLLSKHDAAAFTLIELLVVIAIISLLVSILLPSLSKAKDLARKVTCMTQLRNIGTAFMLYGEEYEQRFFPINTVKPKEYTAACWNPTMNTTSFTTALAPFMDVSQADLDIVGPEGKAPFICPADDNLQKPFVEWKRKSSYFWNPMIGQPEARDGHVRTLYVSDSRYPNETNLLRCGVGLNHPNPGWGWLFLDYTIEFNELRDFWWDGPSGFWGG